MALPAQHIPSVHDFPRYFSISSGRAAAGCAAPNAPHSEKRFRTLAVVLNHIHGMIVNRIRHIKVVRKLPNLLAVMLERRAETAELHVFERRIEIVRWHIGEAVKLLESPRQRSVRF